MLTPKEEAEIQELAGRLGPPLRWTREYTATTERNREWARKVTRRRAEVILVLPRPGGLLLVHTKSTYPKGINRLPGGGVDRDEAVEIAARREAFEETGLQVVPARLLGVIENTFNLDGHKLSYPSYIIMMEPTTAMPSVQDLDEQISGFSEFPPQDLPALANQLNALPADWQPWGQFRAAPHALVAEALGMTA
jgi:8-oxo-dGTP pyrophosphatase MutT (NUDIX family)